MVLAWSRQHASASGVPHAPQQHRPLCAVHTIQAGPTDPKHALNRRIKEASSILELLQLHGSNRHLLDDVHLSALFGKLATACCADSVATGSVNGPQQQQQQLLAMSDSTQQVIPGHHQLQQQLQHPRQHQNMLLSALLDDLLQQIQTMRPRAVSSILWALAKLHGPQQQHQVHQVVQLLLHRAHQQLGFHAFEPRQLCSIAYALTRLGPRKQHSNESSKLQQRRWDAAMLRDLYTALGRSLQFCCAQDAAQAVYTMAQLQHVPPTGWLNKWLKRSHQLLPNFTAQGLANSAYGLVRVLELSGQIPSRHSSSSNSATQEHQQGLVTGSATVVPAVKWLLACLRVSVLHLPRMQPGELYGQLLWACGKLRCQLPQPAQHHILARGEALFVHSNSQQLATALYCFALLQQQPPESWLQHFWRHVSCKLDTFQGLELAKLLWSAAQLQLQPPEQLLPLLLQRVSCCLHPKQSTQPGYLVSTLHSMVNLGWRLPQRYLVRFQAAVVLRLPRFSSRDYSNMLWALAAARVRVDARWLDRVLMASCSQLSALSPTDLSITLWAVAKLQHTPSRQWLMQMLSCSLMHLNIFKSSHFSNTLWALSKLGSVPSPLWLNTFWSTSGQTLTKFSPAELTATVSAVVKLELTPPVEWVQQLTTAVDQNLAVFDSKRLLHVLQAVQQLQARAKFSSSSIGVLQYGNSNGSRGYIYSSSIVPFGRLQLQPDSRAVGSIQRGVYNSSRSSLESQLPSGLDDTRLQASAVAALQQLDSFASEAYSIACLVTLMPDWLQHRVAHWPKQLAAERVVASNCQARSRQLVGAVG